MSCTLNQETLQKLAGLSNVEELGQIMEVLCRPFGNVKHISVLPANHAEGYLCVVEFDSPHFNPSIIEKLGGSYFGNSAVFRIPFKRAKKQVPDG
jgi:hypothetical protein